MQETTGKWFCECSNGWNGPTCEIPNPELTCGTDKITVLIDKRMIVGNKLENNAGLISFGGANDDDESCKAKLDGEHYRLEIKAPFADTCGTKALRAEGDSGDYIFNNDVMWKKVYAGQQGEEAIQRKIKLVDFNCHYEDEYLLAMIPIKPAEAVIEQKTNKGNFKIDMTLWKNSDFERDLNAQYSSNPIVRVGHEVCVKLEVDSMLDIKGLVLTASDCWASAVSNPTEEDKHFIINHKCKDDGDYTTTIKENGIGDTVKFCFKVYKWNSKMDNLYVQCKMSICDDSIQFDGHSQCVCPPKSYETNTWFYPNYYEAQMDYLEDKYSQYYNYGDYGGYADYGDDYGGLNLAGDSRGVNNNNQIYGNNNNYGMFYYDYTSPENNEGSNAYDMIKRRKRRATEGNDTTSVKLNQGGDKALPTHQENMKLLEQPAKSKKRKRFEFKGTFEKDEDGNPIFPKGIKTDPAKDLIDVGYGPITIKDEQDEAARMAKTQALSDVIVAEIDDQGEWFESSEGANNVILIAVGGSLIFAIIVLGIVIFVYVQFKNEADKKAAKHKIDLQEKQKAKNFFKNVMHDGGSGSDRKARVPVFEPETVSTVTED